jgi:hypothetical protein
LPGVSGEFIGNFFENSLRISWSFRGVFRKTATDRIGGAGALQALHFPLLRRAAGLA